MCASVKYSNQVRHRTLYIAFALCLAVLIGACDQGAGPAPQPKDELPSRAKPLSGVVRIAGSPTVGRITRMVAEGFAEQAPSVQVILTDSGDHDAFALLCNGLIEIAQVSRRPTPDEVAVCERNRFNFVELKLGRSEAHPLYIYVNRGNAYGLGGGALPAFVDLIIVDLNTWVIRAGYSALSQNEVSVLSARWNEAKDDVGGNLY
jgi:PBP superfamily domain